MTARLQLTHLGAAKPWVELEVLESGRMRIEWHSGQDNIPDQTILLDKKEHALALGEAISTMAINYMEEEE